MKIWPTLTNKPFGKKKDPQTKFSLPLFQHRSSSVVFGDTDMYDATSRNNSPLFKARKTDRESFHTLPGLMRQGSIISSLKESLSIPNFKISCKSCTTKAGLTSGSPIQQLRLDKINDVLSKIDKATNDGLKTSLSKTKRKCEALEDEIKIISKIKSDEIKEMNRSRWKKARFKSVNSQDILTKKEFKELLVAWRRQMKR
ncbi:unnamed protein product [Blepharisma stoltei]|uniref:Uncharacterized protein n=1 Tax=Blepharisma stoltei TaxID=1481888 RepID=A0AAU9JPN6_9CILI|nr:unnamed protein product [Blepharisma stoltei]